MDGWIWFGGIALMLLVYVLVKAVKFRRAYVRMANAQRRQFEREQAWLSRQAPAAPRPDAADYALQQWKERGK